MLSDVGFVIIGRNEGEKLRAAIASAVGQTAATIYVDSGSSDASLTLAADSGADVISLDAKTPFTAARARNEGLARLLVIAPDVQYVQFMDGDCTLIEGWLTAARNSLAANPKLAAVCGRRHEIDPHNSLYNQLIDLEWATPIGPAKSVGGDAIFRISAFNSVKGFDPAIAAGEEPELCLRLRDAGWAIFRLDTDMTEHDANILTFSQWCRRQFRSGYGAADVAGRCRGSERLFSRMLISNWIWTIGWLAGTIAAIHFLHRVGMALSIAVLLAQVIRIAAAKAKKNVPWGLAITYGMMTLIGKWPMLWGQLNRRIDGLNHREPRLIEYKEPTARP